MKIYRFMLTDFHVVFFINTLQAQEFRVLESDKFGDARIATCAIKNDIGITPLKIYDVKPSQNQMWMGCNVFMDEALEGRFAIAPFDQINERKRSILQEVRSTFILPSEREEQ